MAASAPRKRKTADPQSGRTIKTSLLIDAELHTKIAAAAAMQGVDRNALVVEILREALGGIVVFDRRKTADRVKMGDRQGPALGVTDSDEEAA